MAGNSISESLSVITSAPSLPLLQSLAPSGSSDTSPKASSFVLPLLPNSSQPLAFTTDLAVTSLLFNTITVPQADVSSSAQISTSQSGSSTSQAATSSVNSAVTSLQTNDTTSVNPLSSFLNTLTSQILSTAAFTSSTLPTSLISSPPLSPTQRRTILAVSLSAALLLFLSLILAAIFLHHRRRKNKYDFLDALAAPVQKEHSRACLLAGEDMDEVTATSGLGSFGHDVFGRVIDGQHRDNFGTRAGSYQDISYIPPPPTTPWDISLGIRSSMEALHHPSRVQPFETRRYTSQHLSRCTEADIQGVGTDISNAVSSCNVGERERVQSLEDPARSASEVDLSAIVDSVMGNEFHLLPMARSESPDRPTHALGCPTYSAVGASSFVSIKDQEILEGRHVRKISGANSPVTSPSPRLSFLSPSSAAAMPPARIALRVANSVRSNPRRTIILPLGDSFDNATRASSSLDGVGHIPTTIRDDGSPNTSVDEGKEEMGHTAKTTNWLERSVDMHRFSVVGGSTAQERSSTS